MSICLFLRSFVCQPASLSLPIYLFCLYLSPHLTLLQSVFLPSILSVLFWCLPDNLSFCLLSLTMADFLCTSLSPYHSERQPVCLYVHYSLIYYLWLSVCLHLPFSLPMFLSVIPTFKPTQTPFSPHRFVYSHPCVLNRSVHLCEWGRAMILHTHWNIWATRKSFYPYLCEQLAVLKAK